MTENYLRNDLDTHVMKEAVSRSFNFRRADGSSFYAFNLTWNYGHLSISGDMGELMLEHYHAMPTFEKAVHWAADAENQYLLGKSNVREEYDAEKTAKSIIQNANTNIIEALNGSKWAGKSRSDGMRQIAQKIRKGILEKEDLEDYDIYFFNKKENFNLRLESMACDKPEHFWIFSEVWDKWLHLWKALEGFGHYSMWSDEEVQNILKPSYRREMRDAIIDICSSEDGALELLRNLGNHDDYPIMTDYSFTNYRLVSAIRWACQRLISEGIVPEKRAAA
ncbi:hypothetical protein [Acetobacter persici]|uniref:hypothetical protein n=1 Tax=Acetobacter persici TaxID=1076596 RepID=UPI0039E94F8B